MLVAFCQIVLVLLAGDLLPHDTIDNISLVLPQPVQKMNPLGKLNIFRTVYFSFFSDAPGGGNATRVPGSAI